MNTPGLPPTPASPTPPVNPVRPVTPIQPGRPIAVGPPSAISAATPLLLLPVHIQTRFVDGQNQDRSSSELWVRIFPDQIAVDAFETALTAQELADGQAYWNAVWQAGNPPANPDDAKAPWRMLASTYQPQRAAWIALQTTPTNVSAQPVAATPAGSTPVPAPVFPTPTLRASSWEQPAVADALPDAWTVVLVSGTQTSIYRGSTIASPLNVSLTPNGTGFPAGSVVDQGLQWMVDFDTAVAAGMALKIPLTREQRAAGFDQIFVYGLRIDDTNPSQTWTNLLNAHHYTDGLAFVPQGSPTNNTPDASSAYSRKDPDDDISFATERQAPLTGNPNADAAAFSMLTGTPLSTFDHIRYADETGELNASDMLRALWPATLCYFLGQMMADVFTSEVIEQAREYVIANVRPRGPAPTFRTGTTPYGVLPVTSLFHYRPDSDKAGNVEPALLDFVRKLWPTWLASSAGAPHMQQGGDPDQNLMSLLGMDASSMNFRGRPVLGDTFLWNFLNFLGVPALFQGQWWEDLQLPARALLDQYGYTSMNPRLIGFGLDENSFPVNFSTVQTAPLSETDPITADANLGGGQKGNYIQWLQTASVSDIQAENYPGTTPTSLLYKILRQSVLMEYANLAGNEEVNAGRLGTVQLHETELVAMQPATTSLTPWQLLARPSIPNPHVSWAEYLLNVNFPIASPYAQLNDFRNSLSRLAALPSAELDRLLTETLDACSHRLDVWATGIANAMFNRLRAGQNNTFGLGCYGWVENVQPEARREPVVGSELQAVQALDGARLKQYPGIGTLPVPVQPLSDNGGYIYAPSATQAAVAAVLRNGYMTHKSTAEESLLSMDFSSERVQRALTLLRGVQEGQSLNALYGYLFEDSLSSLGLQKYIQPFRNAYPVVGSKLTPSSAPAESVAASNVVDGLALRTAWDAGSLPAGGNWGTGLPPPGADQNAVITILQMLDDASSALGDVSMAEAVFQVVRGNPGRGGGLMDAISRGSRPADPDVVDTPAGGIDFTHRVAAILIDSTIAAAWSSVPQHPRAAAEPLLNAWLSTLLPDPSHVRCQVTYKDSGGNPGSLVLALSDLKVGPLDVLALSNAAQTPQRSELENRIIYAAPVPAGAQQLQIVFDTTGLPAGSTGFPDVLYLAQTLRTFIGSCRALAPQDFATQNTDASTAAGTPDLAELQTRAQNLINSLTSDLNALNTATTPDAMRAALYTCSFYNVTGSIPNSTSGADPTLAPQQTSVAGVLQARLTQASKVTIATASIADLLGMFNTIFGNDFLVLPKFAPPDLSDLQTAFQQSASLVSSDAQAPTRWLRQLTYTHEGISRMDMALSAAQALLGGALYPPSLLLGQMPPPAATPDTWLALPIDPSNPPPKGRIAFACLTHGDPTTANAYAGLMVEQWLERIPGSQGASYVAFHFEEPVARAPNAILLALCPTQQENWDDAMLQAVLSETLQLAKIRTVDLASVTTAGQILPALYFALNLQGATISTRFVPIEVPIHAA
ncbi:hypothetical protein [Dyella nitratireducens]|uniref:Uncharacterized protein n=1 Tax=Dyella nitratireducens TaxID=1849580 RepID=A0ABQ1GDW3_9GAMM|nr:hypothetical protein [Dyella nitratireducens]GGA41855.1 hypothetical protein GCM10010981_33580 [Dyella nitratireducens]GLQ42086.1 hypothetical protein GCM10007902_19360 [Dyella nitratireducens]